MFSKTMMLACVLVAASAVAQVKPAQIKAPAQLVPAVVTADQIPTPPASMQLLKLSRQAPPTAFLKQMLKISAPKATDFRMHGQTNFIRMRKVQAPQNVLSAEEGERLAALVHQDTGEGQMFPNFQALKPVEMSQENAFKTSALAAATKLFARPDLLSHDDTSFRMAEPQALVGATFTKDQKSPPAGKLLLTFVPVNRMVGKFPVGGPGSHAVAGFDSQNNVHAFLQRWQSAKNFGTVKPSRSREQVANQINTMLAPSASIGKVSLDWVELAYYDGGKEWMQPVYRFSATLHAPEGKTGKLAEDEHLLGYVPFGQTREPLPTLGKTEGPQPGAAMALKGLQPMPQMRKAGGDPGSAGAPPASNMRKAGGDGGAAVGGAGGGADPTVGRYVVRNDDPDWVNDANEFWSGLTSFGGGGLFTNSQYFWAEPRLFTTQKNSFINSVQVALNEVHGNWWFYTTYQNWGDGVSISDIPYPGYGSAAGGHLCYWVIHSCEVIPAPVDVPSSTDPSYASSHWWDNWFNVFGGLHAVVGYRTVMYIDDDAGYPVGLDYRLGLPVVGSWLNVVSGLSAYSGHPTYDTHGSHGKPMGRAAAICVSGHDNDSIYDTSNIGRAGSLTMYWFNN